MCRSLQRGLQLLDYIKVMALDVRDKHILMMSAQVLSFYHEHAEKIENQKLIETGDDETKA